MSLFYLCPEAGCNRKYKTKERTIDHVKQVHKIAEPVVGEPVPIGKVEKREEKIKNADKKKQKMKELEEKTQADLRAREEAHREQVERYKRLEVEKLHLEEEKLRLERRWIEMTSTAQRRVDGANCCICDERPADTAAVPCGHRHFCFDCLHSYHETYPAKGCPLCRTEILLVTKIFS